MATWTQLGPVTFTELATAQRDSDFNSPPSSLVIFNTDDVRLQIFSDDEWEDFLTYLGSVSDRDVAVWNDTTKRWEPGTLNATDLGDAPGGELGGTWTTPTVDATHSGSAHHTQSHGDADHSGKLGEVPLFPPLRIVLSKPLPAATNNATLDDDWVYKSPWTNEAVRISRWYIRFVSNLAANATFQLFKNGSQITGAEIAIASGNRDASVDAFTELTLADGDSLEVHQTVGNAEDIGGSAYVYGDQDVVTEVAY